MTIICKTCRAEIDPLDEFPGHLCPSCYEIDQIGRPLPTQQELLAMFTSPTSKIFN